MSPPGSGVPDCTTSNYTAVHHILGVLVLDVAQGNFAHSRIHICGADSCQEVGNRLSRVIAGADSALSVLFTVMLINVASPARSLTMMRMTAMGVLVLHRIPSVWKYRLETDGGQADGERVAAGDGADAIDNVDLFHLGDVSLIIEEDDLYGGLLN